MILFQKLDFYVRKAQEWLLITSLLSMVAILIGNAAARTVFGNSWTFAEEMGRFVLVIITFVGTTMAIRKGQHINMTAAIDLLPERHKIHLIGITNLLTAALYLFLAYASFRYVQNLKIIHMVSPALRIPVYTIYLIMPVSMVLSSIEYVKNSVANFKGRLLFHSAKEG